MLQLRYVFSILISLTLLSACAKKAPSDSGRSKVTFQLPSASSLSKSSVGSFSGSACFAISITASDLPSTSSACDGAYGDFAGLASPGSIIEMDSSFGSNRTIDLFYVISDNGCNSFDPATGLGQTYGANKVYRVAQSTGNDFDQAEVQVQLQMEWPSAVNSLQNLFNISSSACLNNAAPDLMNVNHARVVQGAARGTTANGSQVQVRILDQKLDMQVPNNFSSRIQPVRLGEEQ